MADTPAVPDMRLELVPLPVSDVDRAKAFYEQAGFGNLHDTQVTETMRVVQLTPPGSSCAIVFGSACCPYWMASAPQDPPWIRSWPGWPPGRGKRWRSAGST